MTEELARRRHIGKIVLFGLLLSTMLIYLPGLTGSFLLDDFENLKALSVVRAAPGYSALGEFVLSGISSGLGRPLSLLTFGLQAAQWPTPFAFKLGNLALHAANGILVFLVVSRIVTMTPLPRVQQQYLPLLAAGLWLVHPIHVSTVLYTIQRMTALSAFFMLAGLNVYLVGREKLLSDSRRGYLWMSAGVLGGVGLGMLSKETALLLPVLVFVLEKTLLSSTPLPRKWNYWASIFILLPIAAAVLYVTFKWNAIVLTPYKYRDFTLLERLLTEARILFDYAAKIMFPRIGEYGLFHDDFRLSTGFLTPLPTLAAAVGLLSLTTASLLYAKRFPVAAFGTLWFLTGHSLESTIFPLELYFEHRNYLPSLGPLLAVSYLIIAALNRADRKLRAVLVGAFVFISIGIALVTLLEARLWGNPALQATVWAEEKPDSIRAQSRLGEFYIATHQYQRAARLYEQMASHFPSEAGMYAFWLALLCRDQTISRPSIDTLVKRFETARFSTAPLVALDDMISKLEVGECQNLPVGVLSASVDALLANPAFKPQRSNLHLLRGRFRAVLGHYDEAVDEYGRAGAVRDHPAVALAQARWSYMAGNMNSALVYLDKAERLLKESPLRFSTYETTLRHLWVLVNEHQSTSKN